MAVFWFFSTDFSQKEHLKVNWCLRNVVTLVTKVGCADKIFYEKKQLDFPPSANLFT